MRHACDLVAAAVTRSGEARRGVSAGDVTNCCEESRMSKGVASPT